MNKILQINYLNAVVNKRKAKEYLIIVFIFLFFTICLFAAPNIAQGAIERWQITKVAEALIKIFLINASN